MEGARRPRSAGRAGSRSLHRLLLRLDRLLRPTGDRFLLGAEQRYTTFPRRGGGPCGLVGATSRLLGGLATAATAPAGRRGCGGRDRLARARAHGPCKSYRERRSQRPSTPGPISTGSMQVVSPPPSILSLRTGVRRRRVSFSALASDEVLASGTTGRGPAGRMYADLHAEYKCPDRRRHP